MRKCIFLLMSLLTTVIALSQQVKGTVKDENGKPVAGATISLLKASDSATVKLATTKENGDYAINPVTPGSYRISVSFVGHEQAYGASFEVEQADVQVPAITLTRSATAT
ncbi:MAG TPA: carboxypeptidase-like regulatory domain-containing protein, partial [Flavisolibacter sp.]|nr:carboxypeptidase-like regulatory domain-containing protein [Flavisolibacter sp.]